uniref:ATP synthase F0 subunit 8 n=1 Tax=Thulinius sp. DVL-2010 TaxID=867920 RepID=F8RJB3_9BILA|nr:ATP synthase F0 subunit 8 [Thulinius sp. DVL-2010]ADK97595.1 ATP synthase F0 subunit 8 [Thulinius sp. DVL-2010]
MPHMANLPWLESYCSVLLILIILMSMLFFSPSTFTILSNTKKMSKKNYWKW